jgi:hypothetical protein
MIAHGIEADPPHRPRRDGRLILDFGSILDLHESAARTAGRYRADAGRQILICRHGKITEELPQLAICISRKL